MQQIWVDGFLLFDAVFVTLLVFADWLLGQEKRVAMRERVGEWWIRVQDVSFTGLMAEDAGKIHARMEIVFGSGILSARRLLVTSGLILALTVMLIPAIQIAAVLILINFIPPPDTTSFLDIVRLFWDPRLTIDNPQIATTIVVNILTGFISLAATMFFLQLMARGVSLIRLLVFIGADLVSILFLFLLNVMISFTSLIDSVGLLIYSSVYGGAAFFISILFLATVSLLAAIISILPSIFHLGVAASFMLSKIFRPLIQKPLELLLIRFHESPQGVLTQLAIGIGFGAKLLQAGAKFLT